MSAKSIIEVDVDPEGNFRQFYEQFQEYQKKAEESSEIWEDTSSGIEDASEAMDALVDLSGKNADFAMIAAYQANVIAKEIRAASASSNALLEGLSKNTKAQKNFADESERGNKALEKMKKNAEGVAHSIFGVGKFLMKVGAWGAGLAGLGGLLGAISLKDLASSAVDTQRGARGLGMTPGQLTAFNQDFGGRYLDQSVLGSIADSQNSFAGRMWLARAAAMNVGQVGSEDPGKLAGQLAIRAHNWWANTPEAMRTAENLQSSGFSQSGFSLQMMRQLGNTPLSELQRASAQYEQDQGKFNVGDKNTDAWYGFLRQIKDAGNTIETDLKNRLVALAPDLQRFVNVFGKDAKMLIDDIFTPQNLDSLAKGIDSFATYLGSNEFRQNMKAFVGLIGIAAEKMRWVAQKLGIDIGSDTAGSAPAPAVLDANEVKRETRGISGDRGAPTASEIAAWNESQASLVDKAIGKAPGLFGMDREFSLLERDNKLPAGLLGSVEEVESHGDVSAISPKGARGPFQLMPGTAKQYGVPDPFHLFGAARGAGAYLGDLSKKYGGDVKKALAAYNWGPGNLDRDIATNGANWESGLPAETKSYLSKVMAALAKRQPNVTVTINNNTAARVAVQTNAAAAQ